MKLTVLVDNNTLIDRYFIGEPGLSFYIEEEGWKYLFDTGYSDVFMQNAARMGINLLQVDSVVLSHGHNDHTWGLVPLMQRFIEAKAAGLPVTNRPGLIAHPNAFLPKRLDGTSIGPFLSKRQLRKVFDVRDFKETIALSRHLIVLGEIPRVNDFEAQEPVGEFHQKGEWKPDMLLDDTALVYMSDKGMVIMTGCAHAGICNIVEYARKACYCDKVHAIIGGFHLQNCSEERLAKTADFLVDAGVDVLYPCHCTDLQAKMYLGQRLKVQEVGVGMKWED
jgi:7,8-dihydropterin-6-yl-methyl-4-(beta-D-ribofuranosyl)aminobenzene 5'-phosphate synthase